MSYRCFSLIFIFFTTLFSLQSGIGRVAKICGGNPKKEALLVELINKKEGQLSDEEKNQCLVLQNFIQQNPVDTDFFLFYHDEDAKKILNLFRQVFFVDGKEKIKEEQKKLSFFEHFMCTYPHTQDHFFLLLKEDSNLLDPLHFSVNPQENIHARAWVFGGNFEKNEINTAVIGILKRFDQRRKHVIFFSQTIWGIFTSSLQPRQWSVEELALCEVGIVEAFITGTSEIPKSSSPFADTLMEKAPPKAAPRRGRGVVSRRGRRGRGKKRR